MLKFVFALVMFIVTVVLFSVQTEEFWEWVVLGLVALAALHFYFVLVSTKDVVFGTTKGF